MTQQPRDVMRYASFPDDILCIVRLDLKILFYMDNLNKRLFNRFFTFRLKNLRLYI